MEVEEIEIEVEFEFELGYEFKFVIRRFVELSVAAVDGIFVHLWLGYRAESV